MKVKILLSNNYVMPNDEYGNFNCCVCGSYISIQEFEDIFIDYKEYIFVFCKYCGIIFTNGCSTNIKQTNWSKRWPKLITEWKYKDKIYISKSKNEIIIPIFDNFEEAIEMIENNKIEIIKVQCICNNDKTYRSITDNNDKICRNNNLDRKNCIIMPTPNEWI